MSSAPVNKLICFLIEKAAVCACDLFVLHVGGECAMADAARWSRHRRRGSAGHDGGETGIEVRAASPRSRLVHM